MKRLKLLAAVATLFSQQIIAQSNTFKTPDSLKNKSFDYITFRIDESEGNPKLDSLYSRTYLAKAKAEKNASEMATAYKVVMYQSDKKTWLEYTDSIVTAAKQTKDYAEIGSAYLTKGLVWYNFKNHGKALESYLIADKYISKTDDDYLIYKTKYSIAQIKYYLGYFEEANALLKECVAYFHEEGGKPYLNSLHALSLTYTRIGKFDKCTETNTIGQREAEKSRDKSLTAYFIQSEGINDYFKKDYQQCIARLREALPRISVKKDLANATLTSYYIGRSYWALGQRDAAVPYLTKVNDAFVKEKFMKVEMVEAYILLIQYYEKKGNDILLRQYLDNAVAAENIIFHESRHLSKKLIREYDVKKITEANDRLEQKLEREKIIKISLFVLSLLLAAIIAIIICRRMQRNRIRKQKFKEIMHKDRTLSPVYQNRKIIDGDQVIKPEKVEAVSGMLTKFENSDMFLDNDITLNKLAAYVGCNTTYTSKIIMNTRGKKYIDYIDSLRINYILDKLKSDRKYRNYTIKALTVEAGFKSPQKFKEAFNKNLDMDPLYFIKELSKLDPDNKKE